MNIKEKLKCKYCTEIYKQPITLNCCGENICKNHVKELMSKNSSSQFMCPLCNQENSSQNLNVNKLIEELVERELYEFELDPKYGRALNNLKLEIEKFGMVF